MGDLGDDVGPGPNHTERPGARGILAFFAQFEQENSAIELSGIAQAWTEGRPHGSPPTAQNKEAEVWSLFEAGLKPAQIAKELGISKTSVRRLLAS